MDSEKKEYWVDPRRRKRYSGPMFTKVTTYSVNAEEVRKFVDRNGRLPDYVFPRSKAQKQEAKSIIDFISENVLSEDSSADIQDIVSALPADNEEAIVYFCDFLELGDWFYDALILNGIEIMAELIDIGAKKQQEEKEEAAERRLIDEDLRQMQSAAA